MNDFNLPIIKETKIQKRILSMDEYLEFVMFNVEHTLDRDAYEKWKKMSIVDVPFSLSIIISFILSLINTDATLSNLYDDNLCCELRITGNKSI